MGTRSAFLPVLIGIVCCSIVCAHAEPVAGVQWPERWVMFGPVSWEDADVDPALLRGIPESLRIGGEEYPGKPVQFEEKRLDISALLGGHERQDTVYLLGEVHAERDAEVLVGAAADWWVACWLNGRPLYDTLESGNSSQDFSLEAHVFRAQLRAGPNLLAVRVSGGREGFLLTAGIPARERWDALLEDRLDEQRAERLSDLLAQALRQQEAGDLGASRALLLEALDVADPGGYIALSLRLRVGESYERDGQSQQAYAIYEDLLTGTLPPWVRPVVQLRLAQTLLAAGETDAARAAYAGVLRMDDAHPLTFASATEALRQLDEG